MRYGDSLPCEHNFSLHANIEMVVDSISEMEVKEVILYGVRTRNDRGSGFVYSQGTTVVVAESEPCHHFIITVYRNDYRKPSFKDKSYRRRRYLRRGKKGMQCPRCSKSQLSFGTLPLEVSGKAVGTLKGYKCPNCLLVFYDEKSSKRIRELIKKLEMKPFSAEEISLILLTVTDQPIRGAISFMKETFLFIEELLPTFQVPIISPNFISYHYGPYSFDLIDAWSYLEDNGLIRRTGRKSTNKETFYLTPKGKRLAKSLLKRLPAPLRRQLPAWRRGLDELGNDGILRDVYKKYPEYTDKSKIGEKVLPRGMRRRA